MYNMEKYYSGCDLLGVGKNERCKDCYRYTICLDAMKKVKKKENHDSA